MKAVLLVNSSDTAEMLSSLNLQHLVILDKGISNPKKSDMKYSMSYLLENFDLLIPVGASVTKLLTGRSISNVGGRLINEKIFPIYSPNIVNVGQSKLIEFKSQIKTLKRLLRGEKQKSCSYSYITTDEELNQLINELDNKEIIALDSETYGLNPITGYILGISIAITEDYGYYIDSRLLTEYNSKRLYEKLKKSKVVLHNAKFDFKWFKYWLDWEFDDFDDTMLMLYALDENGKHDLKTAAMIYTEYGDYEKELEDEKVRIAKKYKIKKDDVTYNLFDKELLAKYAATDAVVTFILYKKFKSKLDEDEKIKRAYERILKPATLFLVDLELNGVPFNREYIKKAVIEYTNRLNEVRKELDLLTGAKFDYNSTDVVAHQIYEVEKLPIEIRTEKGKPSTSKEALEKLVGKSRTAELVLKARALSKLLNTYLVNINNGLDKDDRLRVSFNLHTTVSGRLSSSGIVNMQTMPRDDKTIKKAIRAREGYKIISADLGTAELYVAAALSGDKNLQNIFINDLDFHGYMAVKEFGLDCSPNEVAKLYPKERSKAKGFTFKILYALQLDIPELKNFPTLKRWLMSKVVEVNKTGRLYQISGRCRRINGNKNNPHEISHDVRSAVNSLIQGLTSDIMLMAAVKTWQDAKKLGIADEVKFFALIHDDCLVECKEEHIDWYVKTFKNYVQNFVKFKGAKLKIDLKIADSYGD